MLAKVGIVILSVTTYCYATVKCPPNKQGEVLTCAFACCRSLDSTFEDYFCCGLEDNQIVRESSSSEHGRPQRFVAYGTNFQIDYTLLVIGLIISILLSILCSFFCCLLCNGCWLHRRLNPQLYESVNDSGFYPLCCGFGIPMGTIVFSTHPPQFRDESELYHGSSTSSIGNRSRVRFNEDGTPRGVLKGNSNPSYPES